MSFHRDADMIYPLFDPLMNFFQHWSSPHNPFGPPTSAEGFYAGQTQREAIARLEYLIRSESRSAVMLSERGCGATTLLTRVSGTSGLGNAAVDAVLTSGGVDSPAAALARLAAGLSLNPFGDRVSQRIREAITAAARNQVRTLWLIDRCDEHTAEAAAMLAASNRSLCTVMCTTAQAASDLQGKLDCCPLRIDLDPFELDDSIGYVRFSVAAAGLAEGAFDDAAMVRLHELSDGKVALIAGIARLALVAANSVGARSVTAECVESVQHELVRAA